MPCKVFWSFDQIWTNVSKHCIILPPLRELCAVLRTTITLKKHLLNSFDQRSKTPFFFLAHSIILTNFFSRSQLTINPSITEQEKPLTTFFIHWIKKICHRLCFQFSLEIHKKNSSREIKKWHRQHNMVNSNAGAISRFSQSIWKMINWKVIYRESWLQQK